MIYVILGMAFSGTTLVSELLHHSGISMIKKTVDKYDKGGKYEHQDFQDINREILGLKDKRVRHLRPSHCPSTLVTYQRDQMIKLIQKCQKKWQDWGFKDPRTVVTYPLWKQVLPSHRIIAVYRDPAGNWPRNRWQGLRKRYSNASRAFCHLRQWCEYNSVILKIGKYIKEDFLLLNYERLMQGDIEIERLSNFIGRRIVDRRKPSLYRNRGKGDLLFRCIRTIMNFCGPYRPSEVMEALEQERHRQLSLQT